MAKATSIKDALEKWEISHGQDCATATEIDLQFQYPPIEKLDKNITRLIACQKLSLSTNMIDRIIGVGELLHLKILSLGRNNLKSLNGLEPLGECLEELWVSYNNIEKLQALENFKKLTVLYIAHNVIKDWNEIGKLANAPLQDMVLLGNPVQENNDEPTYKREISKRLVHLKKIDGDAIIHEDV